MKAVEIRKKSKLELDKLLKESRKKMRILYFNLAGGTVKNVREIRKIKKDIARILTILKQIK
ncbi:MAG: 50S ribosomal protein L29 [Candidatus Nealsonbacteria bacterium]